MTNLEWEKKFDAQIGKHWPVWTDKPETVEYIKSFISQTHKDLVEAILEEIPDHAYTLTDKETGTTDLTGFKQFLRAKYLNNKINGNN